MHPGVEPETVQAETGWKLRVRDDLQRTELPTKEELTVLRELTSR